MNAAATKATDSPKVPCACGCGHLVRQFDASRHKRFYVRGHNIRHMIKVALTLARPTAR